MYVDACVNECERLREREGRKGEVESERERKGGGRLSRRGKAEGKEDDYVNHQTKCCRAPVVALLLY